MIEKKHILSLRDAAIVTVLLKSELSPDINNLKEAIEWADDFLCSEDNCYLVIIDIIKQLTCPLLPPKTQSLLEEHLEFLLKSCKYNK